LSRGAGALLLHENREQRDLFPGALEMMILRTLSGSLFMGMRSRSISSELQTIYSRLKKVRSIRSPTASERSVGQSRVGISSTNRRVRTYKLTSAGAKHLAHEVSRFEKMLEGITRVLAAGES